MFLCRLTVSGAYIDYHPNTDCRR